MPALLEINDLSVKYRIKEGTVQAVRGVSLRLESGEILALVGESGAGKTTVGLSILGILPRQAVITTGGISLEGRGLEKIAKEELRAVRGDAISMIFQDPLAGLNPIVPVGKQVEEVGASHRSVSKRDARELALDALAAIVSRIRSESRRPSRESPAACASG